MVNKPSVIALLKFGCTLWSLYFTMILSFGTLCGCQIIHLFQGTFFYVLIPFGSIVWNLSSRFQTIVCLEFFASWLFKLVNIIKFCWFRNISLISFHCWKYCYAWGCHLFSRSMSSPFRYFLPSKTDGTDMPRADKRKICKSRDTTANDNATTDMPRTHLVNHEAKSHHSCSQQS